MMKSKFSQAVERLRHARKKNLFKGYILHKPREGLTYSGINLTKEIICYQHELVVNAHGKSTKHQIHTHHFDEVNKQLDKNLPSVWIISPDLNRNKTDVRLPLLWVVQCNNESIYHQEAVKTNFVVSQDDSIKKSKWTTETDSDFINRISAAIERLQSFPNGKIIITRAYELIIEANSILDLIENYGQFESSAACTHYFSINEQIESFGCSPENIFELKNGRLFFDVVAATRGKTDDAEVDERWLNTLKHDPKEIREHMMAFNRYQDRLKGLINIHSLKIEKQAEILELGKVRHLYSRLSGKLKNEFNWLDILKSSFPALTSYPAELHAWLDDDSSAMRYYGGIIGRVDANGNDAEFFLNLRAGLRINNTLYTQGGVGLIKESAPEKELLEVKNKLRALMECIDTWLSRPLG